MWRAVERTARCASAAQRVVEAPTAWDSCDAPAQRVEGLVLAALPEALPEALLATCAARALGLPPRRSRHSRPLAGGAEGRAKLFVAAGARNG